MLTRADTTWWDWSAVARGEDQDFSLSALTRHVLCYRCGSYPGLYTDVARYQDWIVKTVLTIESLVQ